MPSTCDQHAVRLLWTQLGQRPGNKYKTFNQFIVKNKLWTCGYTSHSCVIILSKLKEFAVKEIRVMRPANLGCWRFRCLCPPQARRHRERMTSKYRLRPELLSINHNYLNETIRLVLHDLTLRKIFTATLKVIEIKNTLNELVIICTGMLVLDCRYLAA